MCTGACLRAAARYCGELGLLGLLQRLLWLRNHLVHHPFCRGCYTYAYDMRNVIMICNFETSLNRIHAPLPETTRRPQFCKPRISGLQSGTSEISGVSGLIPGVFGFHTVFAPKTEILIETKPTHKNRNPLRL